MLSSLLRCASSVSSLSKQLVTLGVARQSIFHTKDAAQQVRHFHGLRPLCPAGASSRTTVQDRPLCASEPTPLWEQLRTFKMKNRLRLRCEDCFFLRYRDKRMVLCRTHPRHKQMKIMPKPETQWILTHATQGTPRQW